MRLQRYWWAASKIDEESHKAGREYVVVDFGCERGWLKRFTRRCSCIRWIGLDRDTSHPALSASEYDEVIACDFSQPLPLPDKCADAVVALHVFEHLQNVELAASEIVRILRPGGVFLAGTPVAPSPVAVLRTALLSRRERAGRNRPWGHVRKFSPSSWCRLCEASGLGIEFVTGSHLIRKSGAAIENSRWWVRLNHLWGSLFPSLGSEVYLSARKPVECHARPIRPSMLDRFWLRADWAGPIVAALMLVILACTMNGNPSAAEDSSFHHDIALLQDENDVFGWAVRSRPLSQSTARLVELAAYEGDLCLALAQYQAVGKDLHLIIDDEHVAHYLESPVACSINVSAEWHRYDDRFVVLSNESCGTSLHEYVQAQRETGGS